MLPQGEKYLLTLTLKERKKTRKFYSVLTIMHIVTLLRAKSHRHSPFALDFNSKQLGLSLVHKIGTSVLSLTHTLTLLTAEDLVVVCTYLLRRADLAPDRHLGAGAAGGFSLKKKLLTSGENGYRAMKKELNI